MPNKDDDAALAARTHELAALAERIGYAFADPGHLERALCHASMGNEKKGNYERLEFLGDAILNFVVAEYLFHRRPDVPVGQLTELRARLVARQPLADVGRALGLGSALEGGRGLRDQDRASPRILADLAEAVLAAVYLDGGMAAATTFVQRWILPNLTEVEQHPAPPRDAKSRILHYAQTRGLGQPTYDVLAEHGPPHDKTFEVGCIVDGRLVAKATGKTRQEAEKIAAAASLEMLSAADEGDEDPQA
ncbi:MAG: ribonuclease III [Planctomycetota bacterium]